MFLALLLLRVALGVARLTVALSATIHTHAHAADTSRLTLAFTFAASEGAGLPAGTNAAVFLLMLTARKRAWHAAVRPAPANMLAPLFVATALLSALSGPSTFAGRAAAGLLNAAITAAATPTATDTPTSHRNATVLHDSAIAVRVAAATTSSRRRRRRRTARTASATPAEGVKPGHATKETGEPAKFFES